MSVAIEAFYMPFSTVFSAYLNNFYGRVILLADHISGVRQMVIDFSRLQFARISLILFCFKQCITPPIIHILYVPAEKACGLGSGGDYTASGNPLLQVKVELLNKAILGFLF